MARIYSRSKGKSGSHKPVQKTAPWVTYSKEEIENIILKLAKKGMSTAHIGLVLRDQYGVPLVKPQLKKGIAGVIKDHKQAPELPEDLMNLLRKAVHLHNHMAKNKADYTSYRGLEITESKIRRLAGYYRRSGALPTDWKYAIGTARLIVKA